MAMQTYSGSITISAISADSAQYILENNIEKITKKYLEEQKLSWDNTILTTQFSRINGSEKTVLIPQTEYSLNVSIAFEDAPNIYISLLSFLSQFEGFIYEEPPTTNEATDSTISTAVSIGNILDYVREIDTTNNKITFNFQKLLNIVLAKIDGVESEDFTNFQNNFNIKNSVLLLEVYKEVEPTDYNFDASKIILIKTIPIEFIVDNTFASFNVTANALTAAAGNGALTFNENGLFISNGGLSIITEKDGITTPLLLYDKATESLIIKGSGTFTGELQGASGTFTGSLEAASGSFVGTVDADKFTANSGEIGGWIIQQDGLYSVAGTNYIDDKYDTSSAFVQLIGQNGKIIATNIDIGSGATLNDYLKLGDNVYIYNPEKNNQLVLKAGAVELDSTGKLQLGSLTLNGVTSEITAKNGSFSITPDVASFNNIVASGKIETALFETNSIQSIGGAMIFNEAYEIVSKIADKKYTLDIPSGKVISNLLHKFLISDSGQLLPKVYTGTIVLDDITQLYTLTLNDDITYVQGLKYNAIDIGEVDSGNLIIGINSDVNTSFGPIYPSGISFIDSSKMIDTTLKVIPKLFLGNMSKLQISDRIQGYGLYGENVFLTGSLTTQLKTNDSTSTNKYAGVNTLNGVACAKIEDDTSQIVFWGGSEDTTDLAIQSAPFQVTENGSIYAAKGTFEGAIITKSRIEGADLYAARIHGWENGQTNELRIYNANEGIVFYSGDWNGDTTVEDTSQKVFAIGKNGLLTGLNSYFISISENGDKIDYKGHQYIGNSFYTNQDNINYLKITDSMLYNTTINDNIEVYNSNLTLQNNYIGLGLGDSSVVQVRIESDETNLNTNLVTFQKDLEYGESIQYKQHTSNSGVVTGYDLYVL